MEIEMPDRNPTLLHVSSGYVLIESYWVGRWTRDGTSPQVLKLAFLRIISRHRA